MVDDELVYDLRTDFCDLKARFCVLLGVHFAQLVALHWHINIVRHKSHMQLGIDLRTPDHTKSASEPVYLG